MQQARYMKHYPNDTQACRALHFCEDQMFWECGRLLANEAWPRGWSDMQLREIMGKWGLRESHMSLQFTFDALKNRVGSLLLRLASVLQASARLTIYRLFIAPGTN